MKSTETCGPSVCVCVIFIAHFTLQKYIYHLGGKFYADLHRCKSGVFLIKFSSPETTFQFYKASYIVESLKPLKETRYTTDFSPKKSHEQKETENTFFSFLQNIHYSALQRYFTRH